MPPPLYVFQVDGNVVPISESKRNQCDNSSSNNEPPPPPYEVYSVQGHFPSTLNLAADSNAHLFSDESIRIGFTRKVFSILSIQVLFTFALVAVFAFVPIVNEFIIRNKATDNPILSVGGIAGTFLIMDFICILLIAFQPKWMTKTPTNYIFLGFVTICTAISLSLLTAFIVSKLALFYIMGMTLSVVLSVTIFTLLSKHELTLTKGFLLAMGGVGLSSVIMYFAIPVELDDEDNVITFLVIAGLLTIFLSMFWIYLVGKMMLSYTLGGTMGKLSRTPEEFILAAMYLYLGSVLIFLILLAILVGGARFRFCCWWYSVPVERQNSQNI